MDLSGKQLGKYSIIKKLGGGGMGNVYLARDTIMDLQVALKVLTPALAADPGFVERFQLEARALARLNHPAIVRVFNADWVDDQLYLTMEYVEGGALDRILQEDRLKPYDWSLTLLEQVAAGLDYAHRLGLVHRDIKPANILVNLDGKAQITDFGLVKDAEISLTADGQRLGTPAYMAPEQIQGQNMGPAVDIYALGIVAFELFAGQTPYRGTISAVFEGHLLREAPPIRQFNPAIPAGIQKVVQKAIAKNPAERFPTAAAFVQALRTAFLEAGVGGETIVDLAEDSPTARVVTREAAETVVEPGEPAGPRGSAATVIEPQSASRSEPISDLQLPANKGGMAGGSGLRSRLGPGALGIGGLIAIVLLCLCGAAAYYVYNASLATPAETPVPTPESSSTPAQTPTGTTAPTGIPTEAATETATATSPPQVNVLYEEDFTVQPPLGFPADFQPQGSLSYADGGYLITVDAPDWAFWGLAEGSFFGTTITVDATNVGSNASDSFGIICRYEGPDDFYYGFITSSGFYGIVRRFAGESNLVSPGASAPSSVIRPSGQLNQVRLDCDGETIRLWANGEFLDQVTGIPDRAGDIGLITTTPLEGGVSILFDNFIVTEVQP